MMSEVITKQHLSDWSDIFWLSRKKQTLYGFISVNMGLETSARPHIYLWCG